MAGIGLNPSGCCCGGSLCVQLTSPCTSTDKNAVTITVKDHTSGVVLATDVTDSAGHVCITGLPSGRYDATATKTNCSTVVWTDQAPGALLTGSIDCYPNAGRRFLVRGCANVPLPGATVTITGAASATLTTDSSGFAYFFPPATGIYNYTISHSSGRFGTSSGVWNQVTSCTTAGVTVTLAPATGYQCCVSVVPIYPISKTLTLTDPGGSVVVDASSCSVGVCVVRPMPNASNNNPVGVSCSPSGSALQPPPDIGTHDVPIEYSINLSTTPTASQAVAAYMSPGLGGLPYRADFPTSGLCTPVDTYQGWRFAGDCPIVPVKNIIHDSISSTINSTLPLNITFTFSGAGSFGPSPTPIGGKAYATTLVLSE